MQTVAWGHIQPRRGLVRQRCEMPGSGDLSTPISGDACPGTFKEMLGGEAGGGVPDGLPDGLGGGGAEEGAEGRAELCEGGEGWGMREMGENVCPKLDGEGGEGARGRRGGSWRCKGGGFGGQRGEGHWEGAQGVGGEVERGRWEATMGRCNGSAVCGER